MDRLNILNPFDAPVYYTESTESTMNISRSLASAGEVHGTVIVAGFQENGRGRITDRRWEMEKEKGLPFTILLRFPAIADIPPALTLRTGLAVSLAIEEFAPSLYGRISVKWPNDIMIDDKKAAGILCEAVGGNVHVGIGVNVAQNDFPAWLQEKACSIALAADREIQAAERFLLLEKILANLFCELNSVGCSWKHCLEQRLYKKNERVVFIEGVAGAGKEITGILSGIGDNGELLISVDGEGKMRSFIAGELRVT